MILKVDRPKTLKENTLTQLRNAITDGTLKPGERLVERSLCDSMGVSRTVVRECIRHLESEWLVISQTSGFVVASISKKEIAEIYKIRSMLECDAVKTCAENASIVTVEELRDLTNRIANHLQNNDVLKALQLTTEFYSLIFTTSGNDVSWSLVERLNARISRLRALTLSSNQRKIKGPQNLAQIVDAIEQKNVELAEDICKKHLQEATDIAMKLV